MPNNEDNNANNNNNADNKKPKEKDEAPVPETVQVGGSPVYKVDKKLGKGGFGQVCGWLCKTSEGRVACVARASSLSFLWISSRSPPSLYHFAGVLGEQGARHEGQGGAECEPGGLEARASE